MKPRARIDPRAFIARGGRVEIGAESIIRAGTMLLPSGGEIRIGDRTSVNQYVLINGKGGVQIGNDVWIGTHAVILDGVRIATGCVIAAGAVVTKDTEAFTIMAGVPAKQIGRRKAASE